MLIESDKKIEDDEQDDISLIITDKDSSDTDDENVNKWSDECVTHNQWNFKDDDSGISMNALLDCKTPNDFYELFKNR